MGDVNKKYLAIMFFLKDYKGNLGDLPGIEKEQKELKKVLNKYKPEVVTETKSVLEDLQDFVGTYQEEEFERVHFHFSGHGKYSLRSETKTGLNSRQETVELAQEPTGECVIGNKYGAKADSIHDLKLELLKMKTDKITMTFDCCRNGTRNAIVDEKERPEIGPAQQKKMFIFYGTLDTQEATGDPGRSFTHFLCSVCEENGGAMEILEIASKVNEKMEEMEMTQLCEGHSVEGTADWENYMWPHQLDKNAAAAPPPQSSGQSQICTTVGGNITKSLVGFSMGSGNYVNIK